MNKRVYVDEKACIGHAYDSDYASTLLYGIIKAGETGLRSITEKGPRKVCGGWPSGRNLARGVSVSLKIRLSK